MATVAEMNISLEDTRWFHQRIDEIVRGPQHGHDLAVIRRYFRGYLHCWKTVWHLIRDAKGLGGQDVMTSGLAGASAGRQDI